MKKKLKVPKLKNENRERDFWAKINLAEYFEPADFEKASFPNLKPTSVSNPTRRSRGLRGGGLEAQH